MVNFYLPRLSAADLLWLLEWTGRAVQGKRRITLVKFTKWLRGIVATEMDRRQSEDLLETDMPWIPLQDWSPKQIGHALLHLFCLSRETDSQAIGEFCDAILDVVVAANFYHAERFTDTESRREKRVKLTDIMHPNNPDQPE